MTIIDLDAAARNLNAAAHGHSADDVWAGLHQLSAALEQLGQERRDRQRQTRNTRARQRYAARKAAGLPGRAAKVEPESIVYLDDAVGYDVEPGCRCQHISCPPCSWCEDGGAYCDG